MIISFQRHTALIKSALQLILEVSIIAWLKIDPQGPDLQHTTRLETLGEKYQENIYATSSLGHDGVTQPCFDLTGN